MDIHIGQNQHRQDNDHNDPERCVSNQGPFTSREVQIGSQDNNKVNAFGYENEVLCSYQQRYPFDTVSEQFKYDPKSLIVNTFDMAPSEKKRPRDRLDVERNVEEKQKANLLIDCK